MKTDLHQPDIFEVKVLPGGRLMLTDFGNSCIKLFTTEGEHLNKLQCRNRPYYLAVLDSSDASKCITAVVTLPK
ncbi:hypothetical protein PoB_007529400 [Plakobranchus ocellatus]|uniref:Uncharacterized protein n=1 Tax=Plakobranchus ocellatus TaxID=259542 RepID=A0AAV4DX45_9GAST|nr:hypothetical protein PoB_007529400 [Plakobranchus ocellatus]